MPNEYWVYNCTLNAEQARVSARFGSEESAVAWCEESLDQEPVVLEGNEPIPHPPNDNVYVVEVYRPPSE